MGAGWGAESLSPVPKCSRLRLLGLEGPCLAGAADCGGGSDAAG